MRVTAGHRPGGLRPLDNGPLARPPPHSESLSREGRREGVCPEKRGAMYG